MVLAEGTLIEELCRYDKRLRDGVNGIVRIYVKDTIPQETLDSLAESIIVTGPVTQDCRVVTIPFEKGMLSLTLIATEASSNLGNDITSWQLMSDDPDPLKEIAPLGIPLVAWAVGLTIAGIALSGYGRSNE